MAILVLLFSGRQFGVAVVVGNDRFTTTFKPPQENNSVNWNEVIAVPIRQFKTQKVKIINK